MTYPDPNYSNRRYAYADPYRDRSVVANAHQAPHHPTITVKVEDVDAVPSLSNSQYSQQGPTPSYYRFGANPPSSISGSSSPSTPVTPFNFMSGTSPGASSSSHSGSMSGPSFQYPSSRLHNGYVMHTLDSHPHHSLQSVQDDYDDGDDDGLAELPPGSGLNGYSSSGVDASGNKANDKQVRRRSSKACDQCRKSKCKCERSLPTEPCKNCILLGTGTSALLARHALTSFRLMTLNTTFSLHVPRSFTETWSSEGLHRCH